jgi:uncharacterized membrane protein YjjP (DUF1212 family)
MKSKIKFIMDLGKALHYYGLAAHEIESLLRELARKFSMEGHFFCTPTQIIANFNVSEDESIYSIERVEPGGINLGLLQRTYELSQRIINDRISIEDAKIKIKAILNSKPFYSNKVIILSYALLSACIALLICNSFFELWISIFLGLIVGLVNSLISLDQKFYGLEEFLISFIVSLLSCTLFIYFPEFSILKTSLASILIFVPGLTVTTALTELTTRNLVAGTARLMSALILFLKIIFGLILGFYFLKYIDPSIVLSLEVKNEIGDFWILGLLFTPLAFTVLLNARMKDIWGITISSFLAYLPSYFLKPYFNPATISFLSAFLIGISGNIYSKVFNRVLALYMVPGLLLIVPGSIGLKGFSSLVFKDTLEGINGASEMFLIATSIAVGILVSNVFFAKSVINSATSNEHL